MIYIYVLRRLLQLTLLVGVVVGLTLVADLIFIAAAHASSPYPPVIGADYTQPKSLQQLNSPNIDGPYVGWVSRYIGSGSGKRLTTSERAQLVQSGWWKLLVFNSEGTGREVNGGYRAGRAQALAALRDPAYVPGYPVIFSVDFDFRGDPAPYLDGAASILGRADVGVYGSVRTVGRACAAGYTGSNWVTYAWRYGQPWPSASCAPLRQVANGALWHGAGDIDVAVGNYRFYGHGSIAPSHSVASYPTARPKQTNHSHVVTRRQSHATVYRVRRGDTLQSIAKRYRTTWRHLAAVNHIRHPNRISVGQRLRVK